MELWPKKKPALREKPLSLESTFGPPGSWEAIETPEQFMEKVDFPTINAIFDGIARRAGVDLADLPPERFVSPERVEIDTVNENGNLGEAYTHKGLIVLYWKALRKEGEVAPLGIRALSTILHEAAHIRSASVHEEVKWREIEPVPQTIRKGRTGVRQHSTYTPEGEFKLTKIDLGFNEAITETLTKEVLKEYLQRTGSPGFLNDSRMVMNLSNQSYVKERILLNLVLRSLSEKMGVEKEVVWQGFVRAYMDNNENLDSLLEELGHELEEDSTLQTLFLELRKGETVSADITVEDIKKRLGDTNPAYDEAVSHYFQGLDMRHVRDVLRLRQ